MLFRSLVLFVGMLSGTYSSIFIATPVLADLKEREPQYQALAKRVSVRASGGRAAKRAAAKAPSGARSGSRVASAATRDLDHPDAPDGPDAPGEPDDSEYTDDAVPPDDELTTTGSRVSGVSGVPANRGTPGPARPGPRQQPRRSGGSSARHRPAGKKKRR